VKPIARVGQKMRSTWHWARIIGSLLASHAQQNIPNPF
jgi:hypothetical protein